MVRKHEPARPGQYSFPERNEVFMYRLSSGAVAVVDANAHSLLWDGAFGIIFVVVLLRYGLTRRPLEFNSLNPWKRPLASLGRTPPLYPNRLFVALFCFARSGSRITVAITDVPCSARPRL